MEKFTKLTGVAAPLPMINVDTDMIIPKQFLKTIKRSGLGKNLFDEMRYDDNGNEIPDFVLNKPAYRNAQILVSGDNFGCGSSREHAPWPMPNAVPMPPSPLIWKIRKSPVRMAAASSSKSKNSASIAC